MKVNLNDNLDPVETQRKMKLAFKKLAEEFSTPATTEVEKKIHNALKGMTIREAVKVLDKVKSEIMLNAPIDSGFNKVL